MKYIFLTVVAALMFVTGCAAIRESHEYKSPRAGALPLDDNWQFLKADQKDAAEGWQNVSLPHEWNNLDGEDGGNNYAKIACWYRRSLSVTPQMAGKTIAVRFQGANRRTDLFVNGAPAGTHVGGFAAFAFDITRLLHPGENKLEVRVSNQPDKESSPLSADFTFHGGLYRHAELLILNPLHITATDDASPGIRIRTSDITDNSATVAITTEVQNDTAAAENAQLIATIRAADGSVAQRTSIPIIIPPNQTIPVDITTQLPHPHRWNGIKDPYLYSVHIELQQNGNTVDDATQPLGIRTFAIDPQKGFLLNGRPYHLHGINRHQDRPDQGWAVTDAQLDEDMQFVKEIGATCIRLAHYQHHPHFYDLCDRAGLIVWTEAPVVNDVTPDQQFTDNAKQQLRELIHQNWNHPSICFWSLGNEVGSKIGDPRPLFNEMNALAHEEDPTRLTTLAFAGKGKEWPGITDTWGKNRYFGWYSGAFTDLSKFLANEGSEAISEYGAGASIYFHSEHPTRMDHTEEYQCLFHETYWPQLKAKQSVWGTYVWCLFDFAADQRKEGDHAGRNDKGLITYDRKTRKDAFYYYKANWSDEPVLHINSKRFTTRGLDHIPVKIYSNATEVELLANGKSLGAAHGENCVFLWKDVPLHEGQNTITARATIHNKSIEDTTKWTYQPGAPTEVYVAQDETMREALKKGPPRPPPPKPATTQD